MYNIANFSALLILFQLSFQASGQEMEWMPFHEFTEGNHISCLYQANDFLYAGHTGDGLYRYSDKTESWEKIKGVEQSFTTLQLIKVADRFYMCTDWLGLFFSDDGLTFEKIPGDLPTNKINCVAADDEHLLIGTDEGLFLKNARDIESEWIQQEIVPRQLPIIQSVAILGENALASSSGRVYWTEDLSEWQRHDFEFTYDIPICFYTKDSLAFIGTGGAGIHFTPFNGMAWASLGYESADDNVVFLLESNDEQLLVLNQSVGSNFETIGKGQEIIRDMVNLAKYKDHYYAGTDAHGIWKFDLPPGKIETEQKAEFKDETRPEYLTAFPNPTQSNLFIKYELHAGESYEFFICDASGKKIKSLEILPLSNGTFVESLSLNLDSGQYKYYLLKEERIIDSGQLLIIQ